MFIDFCVENEVVVTNTRFKKADKEYCTYKEVCTEGFRGPWTPERFQMLDMCLAPNRWKNSILNVRAAPKISLNSDHALLIVDYGARLAKAEKTKIDKTPQVQTTNS